MPTHSPSTGCHSTPKYGNFPSGKVAAYRVAGWPSTVVALLVMCGEIGLDEPRGTIDTLDTGFAVSSAGPRERLTVTVNPPPALMVSAPAPMSVVYDTSPTGQAAVGTEKCISCGSVPTADGRSAAPGTPSAAGICGTS